MHKSQLCSIRNMKGKKKDNTASPNIINPTLMASNASKLDEIPDRKYL